MLQIEVINNSGILCHFGINVVKLYMYLGYLV